MIIFGIILLKQSESIEEIQIPYDNFEKNSNCSNNSTCTLKVTIPEKFLTQKVFLYYELDPFYQNTRKYMLSKSLTQLEGNSNISDKQADSCEPIKYVKDLGKYYLSIIDDNNSIKEINLSLKNQCDYDVNDTNENNKCSTEISNPCGIIAASLFTDSFNLSNDCENNTPIEIDKKSIV